VLPAADLEKLQVKLAGHPDAWLQSGHVVDAIGQEWSLLMLASYGCNELQAFHHVLKCYDPKLPSYGSY